MMLIKKTVSVDIRLDDQEFRDLRHICDLTRITFSESSRFPGVDVRIENLTEEEKERVITLMKEIFNA